MLRCMTVKNITASETSQSHTRTEPAIPLPRKVQTPQSCRDGKRVREGLPRGEARGKRGHGVSQQGDENVLESGVAMAA